MWVLVEFTSLDLTEHNGQAVVNFINTWVMLFFHECSRKHSLHMATGYKWCGIWEWVYHIWDILREFLGHNTLCPVFEHWNL